MLSKVLKLIPGWVIDSIYDAIFTELVRRGDIILEKDLTGNDRN